MKKVLLLVIDALSPHVLFPQIEAGRLPTFGALLERGKHSRECCSVFPSITHACLSSIATGEYPLGHGVMGTFWYEKDKCQIAYYGAQPWVVLNQGLNKFLEDLLSRWNEERLKAPTVFEIVEDAGLRAACMNHLVYRGRHRYDVREPLLMKLLPGVGTTPHLNGPNIMFLGDFVHPEIPGHGTPKKIPHGAGARFGMCDEGSLAVLGALAGAKAFPDFTLAYFPDNDVMSHADGPQAAARALYKLDVGFGEVFRHMGGLDRVLEEFTILITGDHAQVDVEDGEDEGGIALHDVLEGFKIIDAGDPLDDEHELLIAPNLRTAFIYCDECSPEKHGRIVDALLADDRIDQAMWQADTIVEGERGFKVTTRRTGLLHFWQASGVERSACDDYGCGWSWSGDLAAVDARVEGGKLIWGAYPNAFERIACGIGPKHSGHLWATAKPGHGFRLPHIKAHAGGGSHASLHRGDSLVPLIAAGLPEGLELPPHPRIVDILPLALEVLGLPHQGLEEPRFEERMKSSVN